MHKIADFFDVSIDYLLDRTNIPQPVETLTTYRTDDPMNDLPEEAHMSLKEFKEYILRKYRKKKD